MLRIKLVRSPIAHNKRNRATVEALGLTKLNQVKELPDNPAMRGMVFKVKDLLEIEVPDGTPAIPDSRNNPRLGHKVKKGVTPPGAHRKH